MESLQFTSRQMSVDIYLHLYNYVTGRHVTIYDPAYNTIRTLFVRAYVFEVFLI